MLVCPPPQNIKPFTVAQLTLAHVLALRLYTSPVFSSLNNPLRQFKRDEKGDFELPLQMEKPHNFPLTISYIDDGIRKLRAVDAAKLSSANESIGELQDDVVLWRGMRDIKVSDEFGSYGGVELAPMSTSYSLDTAIHYALKGDVNIIFRIVSASFMERGANIEYLSSFPREQECLFPPFTFLSPTGRSQRIGPILIVEVTPRL